MSRRKDTSVTLIIFGVVVIIVAAFLLLVLPNIAQSTTKVWLGDGIFQARVISSEADRSKGLSGVENLAADQALLMVFPHSEKWGIWMKDMKVPIDIVWLNEDKRVVYIVKNASPETSELERFVPKSEARYVIELPAGTVDSKVITTNRTAVFDIEEGIK
ncbi:MAG TPA: DUF192 domain-containing protein [Candidatus Saccharimonadales bacterium]|nr:DUF192 domain-containing protein [Candidatus Saccharimonadales bacterium]